MCEEWRGAPLRHAIVTRWEFGVPEPARGQSLCAEIVPTGAEVLFCRAAGRFRRERGEIAPRWLRLLNASAFENVLMKAVTLPVLQPHTSPLKARAPSVREAKELNLDAI